MTQLDFNDLLIEPSPLSSICSRSEVNVYRNDGGLLPLITAPMDTVISLENEEKFRKERILTILPRNEGEIKPFTPYFFSVSLIQIEEMYQKKQIQNGMSILIDVANGHMVDLYNISKKIKEEYSVRLIIGNIASPEAYYQYASIGVDMIRCGIGYGSGCFIENTVVTTDKGDKFIQDIEIGDLVLTHTNEFKQVISTINYPTSEELISINGNISTKDHEYYCLHEKYVDLVTDENIHNYAVWIEAEKITEEYYLLESVINV